ncbi:MAG: amino acid permease [Gammaproteobacteria bacterium]
MANRGHSLGLVMLTALVVGNMIGSGIFLLPSALAQYGSISLLGWGFTAVGAMLLALVFARLSRAMPSTGGPYAFCREAFGDFIGFQAAYCYWVYAWIGNAAIAVAFAGYLGYFFPELSADPSLRLGVLLITVWLLTGVSMLGTWQAGILQVILTAIKVCPLLFVGVAGLFFFKAENFLPFNATDLPNMEALMAAATLTLWAFIGMESATIPAGDVHEPEKKIPKATIIGVTIVALVYLLGSFSIMGVLSNDVLRGSHAPYADAALQMFPGQTWIAAFIAFGAVVSCLGALNGWIMVQAQVPMAAARDGLFPKIFGKTNKQGVPYIGLLISSTFISILLVMSQSEHLVKQFEFIILLATTVVLIPYAYSTIGEIIIFCRNREKFRGVNFVKSAIMASLAFAYVLWAIAGSGLLPVFYAVMLLLGGTPIYVGLQGVRMGK